MHPSHPWRHSLSHMAIASLLKVGLFRSVLLLSFLSYDPSTLSLPQSQSLCGLFSRKLYPYTFYLLLQVHCNNFSSLNTSWHECAQQHMWQMCKEQMEEWMTSIENGSSEEKQRRCLPGSKLHRSAPTIPSPDKYMDEW